MGYPLQGILHDGVVPLTVRFALIEPLIQAILDTAEFHGEVHQNQRYEAAERACMATGIAFPAWLQKQKGGE